MGENDVNHQDEGKRIIEEINRRGAETQRMKIFLLICAQRCGVRVARHRFGMPRSGEAALNAR